MEAASPPLTFPVSAVQATGPPLRPQGSLPRSLRDGSCGPPLTPEPLRPLTAQWQGAGTKPLPAGPHGAHDQAQQNKVSTVSGDCHTHWTLADGTDTEILNWLDDHSRYLLACTAYRRVNGGDVVASFTETAQRHGLPASTLTDNGSVYTARFTHGHNDFERLLANLCITQKNGHPNHPLLTG